MSPNETASERGSRALAPTNTSTATTTSYTLLHVVGSPKDTFSRNMSVMHGRAAAKAGYDVAGLSLLHRYALVHPGGLWSFPLDLVPSPSPYQMCLTYYTSMSVNQAFARYVRNTIILCQYNLFQGKCLLLHNCRTQEGPAM